MALTVKYLKSHLDDIVVSQPAWKKSSVFANSRVVLDGKPLKIKLQGSLLMPPTEQEAPWGEVLIKMGCLFNEDDLSPLEHVHEKLFSHEEEFKGTPVHNEGAIFFKLKKNKNDFGFETNVHGFKPNKLTSDKIVKGMNISLEVTIGSWFKKDSQQFGLVYTINKITFGPEKAKPVKRKKVEIDDDCDITIESSNESIEEFGQKKKRHMSRQDERILKQMNN
jgi:hypothetical protein